MSPTKAGNRSNYLHTSEGIAVPPLDHLDGEYDFMHDLSQHSVLGEPFGASPSAGCAKTIGSSSSNSSAGSKKFGTGSQTADSEKLRKQKRSSVFSTKTKASKKDGYKTDDSSAAANGKDTKRKSYTFGSSFTKAKVSTTDAQLLPVTGVKGGKTIMSVQRDSGDLPLALAAFLRDAVTFEMDIDRMKRLRFLLASESTR